MTAAFLQSELSSLVADSKKKFSDIRVAAERSLADLKAISVTSETQLAGDLLRRPHFIDAFILACKSGNARLAGSGTICLQRLTASRAVAKSRLEDVVDAFQSTLTTGFDAQLKILQTLPSLLQLYASELRGDLLAKTLEICATLQTSKTALVNKTAAATFEQLTTTVFDQAEHGIAKNAFQDVEASESSTSHDETDSAREDAYRLFNDFCLLFNQEHPEFLRVSNLSPRLLMEILDLVLFNHESYIKTNQKYIDSCQKSLVPGLLKVLNSKDNFVITSQTLKLCSTLVKRYLEQVHEQLHPVLNFLVNGLDRDVGPPWKRILFLEFFRGICVDFASLRNCFARFESDRGTANLITSLMAAMVRIAAEDPSLIGLGRQSTIPIQQHSDSRGDDIASVESQGVGGGLSSVGSADSNATGISLEWSTLSTPLLDLQETANIPEIPSTYIFTLILGCISAYSDGLSKYIMPLSVTGRLQIQDSPDPNSEDQNLETMEDEAVLKIKRPHTPAQKYQRLMNPLKMANHPYLSQVQICSKMIDDCWPAILATCSTFLNAALDSHYYHVLIRSIQKLAQVSGVLDLATPRDALLTTLAKASVPVNANTIMSTSQFSWTNTSAVNKQTEEDSLSSVKSPTEAPSSSVDHLSQAVNIRHLLCLRALLNLGIALGPTLSQDSWYIITETLEQVESLLTISMGRKSTSTTVSKIGVQQDGQTTLGAEISAVKTATKRMFESSRSYSDESFKCVADALLQLIGGSQASEATGKAELLEPFSPVPKSPLSKRMHHASRNSVSGLWAKGKTLDIEFEFVLAKISDLSRINLHRFIHVTSEWCTWDLIIKQLLEITTRIDLNDHIRLGAASIIDLIAMETVKLFDKDQQEARDIDTIQFRCVKSLLQQIKSSSLSAKTIQYGEKHVHAEIHKRLLESLEGILSQTGDELQQAWSAVFDILDLTFVPFQDNKAEDGDVLHIISTAYRSVQLIASDFLLVLNDSSIHRLTNLLYQFGRQRLDTNIALNATIHLRGISSLLMNRLETVDLTTLADPPRDVFVEDDGRGNARLWMSTMRQLIKLCLEQEADVRDATIRVLLQVMDGSSQSLSPRTWHTVLSAGPLAILKDYEEKIVDPEINVKGLEESAAHLLENTVEIIAQNIDTISSTKGFENIVSQLMEVIQSILERASFNASFLAFSCLSNFMAALAQLKHVDPQWVHLSLNLWSSYHPANIAKANLVTGKPVIQKANQPAFTSHAHVFIESHRASSSATVQFEQKGRSMESILTDCLRNTLLYVTHPPYTSDVKDLSSEQQEVMMTLPILKAMSNDNISSYAHFILELIQKTVNVKDRPQSTDRVQTGSRTVLKPTFIAFASACVDNIREMIHEYAPMDDFMTLVATEQSLKVLSDLSNTKYSAVPLNNAAPLWKNATNTSVLLVECIAEKYKQSASSIAGLTTASIVPACASILNATGLENNSSEFDESTILKDEDFDVQQFQHFHAAAISLLSDTQSDEDIRKNYVLTLFRASLVMTPWYGDMPKDLLGKPLDGFSKIRAGSVRAPTYPPRMKIVYAAFDALFELVARRGSRESDHSSSILSETAAPYVLLRIAYPLKTFIADQRLRGLTPPSTACQTELETVLTKALELQCDDAAFHLTQRHAAASSSSLRKDGKSHLRLLYPLILRLQAFWTQLPRLKGAGAWQAGTSGKRIEAALWKWQESVGEDWSGQLDI